MRNCGNLFLQQVVPGCALKTGICEIVGASLLAIVRAIVRIAAQIASNCSLFGRSRNIAISSDQAAWQEDVPAQAARVVFATVVDFCAGI